MTVFYFVRHGVTSHTGHRLSGWMPGIHLTDEGRDQAEATAEMLTAVPFKAIYSSPIDRTMETAAPIARIHGLEIVQAPNLGEVEYGKWSNRTFKTLGKTKLWEKVQRYPSGVRFPEGETLREVQTRAVEEVEEIAERHRRQIVCCVSHADVIRLLAAHYLGVHIDLFQRLTVAPASVSVIALNDGRPLVVNLNTSPPNPAKDRS
ncbi:MAG: MSMEG_4193 family putative phosphomutase [Actinobacteria bacterium]|nr:MSMEG_4193 family putative phosphomutase [Actinomycetota bacterium]